MSVKLAIIGDPMLDVWVQGQTYPCADGCMAFREGDVFRTPGGAANAARQLKHHPKCEVSLLAPVDRDVLNVLRGHRVNLDYVFQGPQTRNPVKRRCLDEHYRVLYRTEQEPVGHGLDLTDLEECQGLALKALRHGGWDGVLLADYAKGFLTAPFVQAVIDQCNADGIPIVADAKGPPKLFQGSLLKCNSQYALRYMVSEPTGAVITQGPDWPRICGEQAEVLEGPLKPVVCVNHIGAGDCFAAWLLWAMTYYDGLKDCVEIAHHAGRIYVQHPYGRPPWRHEVSRDMDGKKEILPNEKGSLRQSLQGKRVIFTNGVFRTPHAGHSWLLRWAKSQGDVLVVGINDDASAARLKPGLRVLPLAERVEILSSWEAVDWVIPFAEDTPEGIIQELQPDALVKGSEFQGCSVPGAELTTLLIAPEGPFPWHCTDYERAS